MSAVHGADTKPELTIRRGLHAKGFRFRLHRKDLPGRPDLALPGHHAVVLVHGCFWHGHDCALLKIPETDTDKWRAKIVSNMQRDARNDLALAALG